MRSAPAPTVGVRASKGTTRFFTGNIGHHLSASIPNYNLQVAHDDNAVFHSVPLLTLWQGIRATRSKLWDEQAARLVTFGQARATRQPPAMRAAACG